MKKLTLLLLLITLSCSRDSTNSENTQPTPTNNTVTVKQIHYVENGFDYNTPYSTEGDIIFSYIDNTNKLYQIKNTNKHIENGTTTNYEYITTFNYSNNRLDNILFSNSSMKFNYTNSKLVSIDYYNIKGWTGKNANFTLQYDNTNRIEKIICNHPYYKVENNLQYSNNKLSKVIINKDNTIYKQINLSYDNKYNAFKNLPEEVKIYFALIDGYGYFLPYDEYYYLNSFWGDNNINSYESNKFEYTYSDNNYIKTSKVIFPYTNTQNTIITSSYTY